LEHLDKQPYVPEDTLPVGEPVKARLKWFNNPKGFGFVVPDERPDVDAFLHITTLQKADVKEIGDGAYFICHIQYGAKGAHVTHVEELIEPGALPKPILPADGPDGRQVGQTQEMGGTVKWYNPDKEFGFVVPDDGKKDVFIHKTCLEKQRIEALNPGQRVSMTFRSVPKGREVVQLKIEE